MYSCVAIDVDIVGIQSFNIRVYLEHYIPFVTHSKQKVVLMFHATGRVVALLQTQVSHTASPG